jgi:hypothetical protein
MFAFCHIILPFADSLREDHDVIQWDKHDARTSHFRVQRGSQAAEVHTCIYLFVFSGRRIPEGIYKTGNIRNMRFLSYYPSFR